MELCKTQVSHKKNLDENETAAMIKETAVKAIDRMYYIDKWAKTSNISTDPILREYNIEINLNMIELNGRVLEAPTIQYGQLAIQSKTIGNKGSWDHRDARFNNPKSIDQWVILNLNAPKTNSNSTFAFHDSLLRIARVHGMNINRALDYFECRPYDRDVQRAFENIVTKFKNLEMILVIMGGTTLAYKVIKTLGEIQFGVLTQGVDARNVYKMNDQTISNILLKMNSKLGGKNFILADICRLI